MTGPLTRLARLRLWPLIVKELLQISRNRRLVISLVIPPTLSILIFGFALNPEVTGLRLGIVDLSRSAESRDLISAFAESRAFTLTSYQESAEALGTELSKSHLDIGLVIPPDLARKMIRHQPVDVQLLVDAVDANQAAIAGGYASLIIRSLNEKILSEAPPAVAMNPRKQTAPGSAASGSAAAGQAPMAQPSDATQADQGQTPGAPGSAGFPGQSIGPPMAAAPGSSLPTSNGPSASSASGGSTGAQPILGLNVSGQPIQRASIRTRIALLFNPGLENSWFIVTGSLGMLLVLNGSVVSAASMIKEKEVGTIEQLLMTPATATEITLAKITPLFVLLVGEIFAILLTGWLVFDVPLRGSLLLLVLSGALCVLTGIGIGMTLATFAHSQQQAQLMSFFINPPISMLSGATFPVEAMPKWMQPLTSINPVRHFSIIARGIMLKGVGVDVLYPNLLALLAISLILITISSWRFRKQLS